MNAHELKRTDVVLQIIGSYVRGPSLKHVCSAATAAAAAQARQQQLLLTAVARQC
jgi:hypothetical protein